ncbi:MAG TPA: alpha/beta hydrolase [Myxococcota bacterium]|nr:alpha/beta hydrolase [Myxococcota bacterium]HRY97145.1 alpha/beta hydrolase [Myxococcota bacterium]HSA21387.1 alpha/beta hydrolase [Myxococcota bacterium]
MAPEPRPLVLPGQPDAGGLLLAPGGAARGVLVFAHGGGNDHLFGLAALRDALARAGWALATAHLAGHGRGGRDAFSLQAARERLDALVAAAAAALPAHPRALLGQSLGGALALDRATRGAPEPVACVSAAHALEVRPARWALGELGALLHPAAYRAFGQAGVWGALPAFGPFKRTEFPVRLPPGEAGRPGGYLGAFARALEAMRLLGRLAEPDAPLPRLLLLHGEADAVVPADQARALARAAGPAATLHVFPGVHHLDPLFHQGVLDALLGWLTATSTIPRPPRTGGLRLGAVGLLASSGPRA